MAYDSESDRVILFGGDIGQGELLLSKETWSYDLNLNEWEKMSPEVSPPSRMKHAMAYDSESDRIILFGGEHAAGTGEELNDTWAYDFNRDAWTEMNPIVSPSVRDNHGMAYDVGSDRIILFGGLPAGEKSNETWVYDFNSNTWLNMEPSTRPPLADVDTMAYDAGSDRVVVFGGWPLGSPNTTDMTWTYDLDSNQWSRMNPEARPPRLTSHSMTFDGHSDRVILFGGRTGPRNSNETWAYSVEKDEWEEIVLEGRRPSARFLHAITYDIESRRVVLFGGLPAHEGKNGETWMYEHPRPIGWSETTPAEGPPARDLHAMAYDVESDRAIVFGGDVGQVVLSNDTWAYDFNANSWTEMNPTGDPPDRWFHSMTYDLESDRTILFGGKTEVSGGFGNETWAYDYNANRWTNMQPPASPPSGGSHPVAYDSESDRIILWGGNNGETWAYDYNANSWTKVTAAIRPPPVQGAASAYDSESDRIIMFSGWTVEEERKETWAFDFNGKTWSNVTSGMQPTGRTGHRMAYDSESDRVILFGGQTGSQRRNDTWSYDFNSNTWTEMNPPLRPRARDIHAMIYDSKSDRMVMFGGQAQGPVGAPLSGDTWAYNHHPTPPSHPQDLRVMVGDSYVSLVWEPPSSDGESQVTGYRLFRGEDSSELRSLVETSSPSYFDTARTNCVTYHYAVSAINSIDEGSRSDEVLATPQTTPCAPRNLQTITRNDQIEINWSPPDSFGAMPILGYRVYRGTASSSLAISADLGNVLRYTDPNVSDGLTYSYAVAALNAIGEGLRSPTVMVGLPDVTAPTIAITSPAGASTLTSSSTVVSGTASDNVGVEKVEISGDGTGWIVADGTTSWTGTLTLVEGSNTVHARATDTSGNIETAVVTVHVETPLPSLGPLDSLTIAIVVAVASVVVGIAISLHLIRRKGGS